MSDVQLSLLRLLSSCLIAFIATHFAAVASASSECNSLLAPTDARIKSSVVIKTDRDLINLIHSGFVPSSNDPNQMAAFELYINLFMGEPAGKRHIVEGSLDIVISKIETAQFIEIERPLFRTFEFKTFEDFVNPSDPLIVFSSRQVQISRQIIAKLFLVEAHMGFWVPRKSSGCC